MFLWDFDGKSMADQELISSLKFNTLDTVRN